MSVGAGGGLLAAVRSGRVCRLCSFVGCGVIGAALAVPVLPGAGGWRNIRVPRPALPGYFPAFPRGGRRQHPARAGLLIRQAGQAGRRRKRKRPGQTARRALLLWPLVCTGGNGSGGVRPGAGGGADLLAVPVGMVSAGTVPAVGVPASRLPPAPFHRVNFAVCWRGQILHLTGVRSRCRALT